VIDQDRELFSGSQSIADREQLLLARFAIHSADTKGRKYPEQIQEYRGPFQRDRDRIIHTAAHRRLSHKTQVFTNELGDYHRNRLTHTLEVCSIARTIGRALKINEDLVEAMTLMHDIGHPPFGHSGEDVLDECLINDGGFSHNQHALRIVEVLENRYPDFSGLNLSFETLEGQQYRAAKKEVEASPSLEAQVVDAADSIAYDSHDADDALELGLLDIAQLTEVPIWKNAVAKVSEGRNLSPVTLRRTVVHELIDLQVKDLLENATSELKRLQLKSADEVKALNPIVRHSGQILRQKKDLEDFLMQNVYRHPNVMDVRDKAQQALHNLFEVLKNNPQLLPTSYRQRAEEMGLNRTIGDYLAGMTDRFAWREHARLNSN
jgi:dGTPase